MASDFRDTIGDFGGEKKTVTYTLTLDLKLKKREPEEKKLHERIQESFLNHEFSDAKITCESKVFDCHKVILSCQSDVFKGMFNETEKKLSFEAISGKVNITDISSVTLETMLYYIYHNSLDKEKINGDLLKAADKYMITGLIRICVNHLESNLTVGNAIEVMIAAYSSNQKELFGSAFKFIAKNRGDEKFVKTPWEEMKKKEPTLALQMMSEAILPLK